MKECAEIFQHQYSTDPLIKYTIPRVSKKTYLEVKDPEQLRDLFVHSQKKMLKENKNFIQLINEFIKRPVKKDLELALEVIAFTHLVFGIEAKMPKSELTTNNMLIISDDTYNDVNKMIMYDNFDMYLWNARKEVAAYNGRINELVTSIVQKEGFKPENIAGTAAIITYGFLEKQAIQDMKKFTRN